MKLAVINLTAGNISGGYLKYLLRIIPRMASHADITNLLCAIPETLSVPPNIEKITNIKVIKCKPYNPYNIFPDTDLLKNLKEFEPNILFNPVDRFLKYSGAPIVTMVQNMEPFAEKSILNNTKINLKLSIQKYIGQKALKKSDGIISLSNYVKSYLINNLNIPKSKTSLIYHGIDEIENNTMLFPKILDTYSKEFIFTAGSIRPTRGLEDLINSLYVLKTKNVIINLLIAGSVTKDSNKYIAYLKKMISNYGMSDSVKFLGNLNQQEMSWCYKNSKIFIMTSYVESFGMIAGEAMANGCVCISSRSPCMPEIFNDSAIYYNTNDPKDLANKINEVIHLDKKYRQEMSIRAMSRAKQFSWDTCAKKTVSFLKRILQNSFS